MRCNVLTNLISMKLPKVLGVLLLIAASYYSYKIGGLMAVCGVAAVVYAFYQLLIQKDIWIPIGELALTIGGFQWIIAPMMSYNMPGEFYQMSQDCPEYMMYTVPMYICFSAGYYIFRKNFILSVDDLKEVCASADRVATYLLWIGVLFSILPLNSPLIAQLKVFISMLMYLGCFIKMIGHPERSIKVMAIPFIVVFVTAVRNGMFHALLVWGCFMLIIWFQINHVSFLKKLIIILVAFFSINTLQTVKVVYRDMMWAGQYSGSTVVLFMDLMINGATGQLEASEETKQNNTARYNQGWIISRIYDNVPNNHDYFYGSTFRDAFVSSLLPRFLVPNKKGAGEQSRQDFIEMTGYQLSERTSMGLSILGESYGNFGLLGGALFMFFWGWIIAKLLAFINRLSVRNCYLWILFTPIICYDLIKAEISMMSVLNWTVKGFIFTFIVIYFVKSKLLRTMK